jgi:TRAP transporter 4TM/12TM fusion protein
VLLVWALLVEDLSPGLSAFYATIALIVILLTQKPLLALFRGEANPFARFGSGWHDFIEGLGLGARNMIAIGIATASAGIIVGTVSVTGLGLVMTELVEAISGGNLILMLLLVAAVCLVLGMGMPTTASYIIVSTLMAPVIVEVGSQINLVVPLVAAHMFVFYFGLMADVTPPVGLAAFAAAAVAKADFLKTGATAFFYSIRTGILPFIFIFNTDLLLIDIRSWPQFVMVVVVSVAAMLLFAAGTQGWFLRRNRWYESIALLLVTFTLLRPGYWLDQFMPQYSVVPASQLTQLVKDAPKDASLRVRIEGTTLEGKDQKKSVMLRLGDDGDAAQRIAASGLRVSGNVVTGVALKSAADKAGFEQGFRITGVEVPSDRPAKQWLYIPALLLLGLIALLQSRRPSDTPKAPAMAVA